VTESGATRVAVYVDFDDIVISCYEQVHGRNAFQLRLVTIGLGTRFLVRHR
jgi:hypothetical protein